MYTIVNTEQAEAWNGEEGQHWADHHHHWDAVSGGLNDPLFAAAAIGEQDRVLDVGCGNGQTTRLAARQASQGHAVGVDLSGPMLQRARAIAADEAIVNVRFEQGDAQVHPFPTDGFDVAISRGGVLFFDDPVAAFANIGRALRPGGRLVFACPQDMNGQEWFVVVMSALLGRAPEPNADPYAPGMFSLADPARIGDVLVRAGFEHVTATSIVIPMTYGRDADDAAELFLGTGPVRFLLGKADQNATAQALESVTSALRPYEKADGLQLRGLFWLVSAARR